MPLERKAQEHMPQPTFKDKAALVVSSLALVVSGLSLYFSQLRTSYKVEAAVLESDALGGVLSYQVAILNQGTHRIIVTNAHLSQDLHDSALSVSNPFSAVTGPDLPVIVAPKDAIVLKFRGPVLLSALYERGRPPAPGDSLNSFDGEATRIVAITSLIEAMDFRGRRSSVALGVGDYHITRDTVASAGEPKPNRAYFDLRE